MYKTQKKMGYLPDFFLNSIIHFVICCTVSNTLDWRESDPAPIATIGLPEVHQQNICLQAVENVESTILE